MAWCGRLQRQSWVAWEGGRAFAVECHLHAEGPLSGHTTLLRPASRTNFTKNINMAGEESARSTHPGRRGTTRLGTWAPRCSARWCEKRPRPFFFETGDLGLRLGRHEGEKDHGGCGGRGADARDRGRQPGAAGGETGENGFGRGGRGLLSPKGEGVWARNGTRGWAWAGTGFLACLTPSRSAHAPRALWDLGSPVFASQRYSGGSLSMFSAFG